MIAIRRNHKAFGRGTLRFLYPANRKVLAYIRSTEDECILCVVNVSRSPQAVELDLSEYKGSIPIEMTGGSGFPPVGELPYLLTLPAYGFYWFQLTTRRQPHRPAPQPALAPELFTLCPDRRTGDDLHGTRARRFRANRSSRDSSRTRRWFAGKGRSITDTQLIGFRLLRSRSGRGRHSCALIVRSR